MLILSANTGRGTVCDIVPQMGNVIDNLCLVTGVVLLAIGNGSGGSGDGYYQLGVLVKFAVAIALIGRGTSRFWKR